MNLKALFLLFSCFCCLSLSQEPMISDVIIQTAMTAGTVAIRYYSYGHSQITATTAITAITTTTATTAITAKAITASLPSQPHCQHSHHCQPGQSGGNYGRATATINSNGVVSIPMNIARVSLRRIVIKINAGLFNLTLSADTQNSEPGNIPLAMSNFGGEVLDNIVAWFCGEGGQPMPFSAIAKFWN